MYPENSTLLLLMHSQEYRQQIRIFFSKTLFCDGIKSYLCSIPLFLSGEMLLKFLLQLALNEVCQGTKWSSPFVTSDSIQAYYIAMLFGGFNDVVSIRG